MEKSESIPVKASDVKGVYDGPREFKPIRKDRILLSGDGVFGPTLQGEGPRLGRPVVFVRLHHCNLKCTWCDAYYTWDKDSEEFWTEGEYVTFEECAIRIAKMWGGIPRKPSIVWSGGEPLMQRNQIETVMKMFTEVTGYYTDHEVETNGTVMPTDYLLDHARFNCSPKLSTSGNQPKQAIKPKVLKVLNDSFEPCFKFVCVDSHDLWEIEQYYEPHIDKDKIWIMPEGVVEEEITKRARELLDMTIAMGYNMTPRFQAIFADGAKRGV